MMNRGPIWDAVIGIPPDGRRDLRKSETYVGSIGRFSPQSAIVNVKNFEKWECHELSAEVPQGK